MPLAAIILLHSNYRSRTLIRPIVSPKQSLLIVGPTSVAMFSTLLDVTKVEITSFGVRVFSCRVVL